MSTVTKNPARTGVALVAIIAAVAVSVGYVGVQVDPWLAAGAVGLVATLAYAVAGSGDSISVTFALSLVAAGALILEFVVPQSIVAQTPIEPYLAGLDAVSLTIMVAATILGWWVLDVRYLSGRAKNPETVASKVAGRFEDLIEAYVSVTRVSILFGVSLGLIILNQLGVLAGDLTGIAADAPWIASNLATAALGYLSMGGSLPWLDGIPVLEELGAVGYLAIALGLIIIAAGVDYS